MLHYMMRGMMQHCSDKITAGFGIQQDGISKSRQGVYARSTMKQLYAGPALWVAVGRKLTGWD
jgi:hypothetical protein